MSEDNLPSLEFYKDQECKEQLKEIPWTERSAQLAIGRVWLKNPSRYDYAITGVELSDPRIKVSFSSYWIYPNSAPVLLTLLFNIPKSENWVEQVRSVFLAGDLVVHGYYVVTD
jgi:hypothetical protein